MPIRWKALPVKEAMDKAEAQVNLSIEFLAEAKKIVDEASKGEGLPQYVTQRLYTLSEELKCLPKRCQDKIEGVRGELPQTALKEEIALQSLGEVATMQFD